MIGNPDLKILENTYLRIAGAVSESIVDGPGIRYTVFTQGCPFRCKGCHNPQAQSLTGGMDVKLSILYEEIKSDPLITGITFSGGDPLHPANITEVTAFAKEIRKRYPGKTIWLYTGFLWEEISKEEIVRYLDVCVDGEFEADKKELSLKWKGSSNQRVIDVPKTLHEGKVVLHK